VGPNYETVNAGTIGESGRFIKGVVTYSVMGDLTVMPRFLASPCYTSLMFKMWSARTCSLKRRLQL